MKFRALDFDYQADAESQWWEASRASVMANLPPTVVCAYHDDISDSDSVDDTHEHQKQGHAENSTKTGRVAGEPDWCKGQPREILVVGPETVVEDDNDGDSLRAGGPHLNYDPTSDPINFRDGLLLANCPWSEELRTRNARSLLSAGKTLSMTTNPEPTTTAANHNQYPPLALQYAIMRLLRPRLGFFGPVLAHDTCESKSESLVISSQTARHVDLRLVFEFAMAATEMIACATQTDPTAMQPARQQWQRAPNSNNNETPSTSIQHEEDNWQERGALSNSLENDRQDSAITDLPYPNDSKKSKFDRLFASHSLENRQAGSSRTEREGDTFTSQPSLLRNALLEPERRSDTIDSRPSLFCKSPSKREHRGDTINSRLLPLCNPPSEREQRGNTIDHQSLLLDKECNAPMRDTDEYKRAKVTRKEAKRKARREAKRQRKQAKKIKKEAKRSSKLAQKQGRNDAASRRVDALPSTVDQWTKIDEELAAARTALKKRTSLSRDALQENHPNKMTTQAMAEKLRIKSTADINHQTNNRPQRVASGRLLAPRAHGRTGHNNVDKQNSLTDSRNTKHEGNPPPTQAKGSLTEGIDLTSFASANIFPSTENNLSRGVPLKPALPAHQNSIQEQRQQPSALLLHKQGYEMASEANRSSVFGDSVNSDLHRARRQGDCTNIVDLMRRRNLQSNDQQRQQAAQKPGTSDTSHLKGDTKTLLEARNNTSDKACAAESNSEPVNDPHDLPTDESSAPQTKAHNFSNLEPPIVLCSEFFLENYGEVVGQLASGQWAKSLSPPDQGDLLPELCESVQGLRISFVDTGLIDARGVHFELPHRCAVLIYKASQFENEQTARSLVLKMAELSAIGRYQLIYVFIAYDTPLSPQSLQSIARAQSPFLRQNKNATSIYFKTTSSVSLSECIAETILRSHYACAESNDIPTSNLDNPALRRQLELLLSILPTLSARGACQILHMHPFSILLRNPRLRQKLMLMAGAVPPTAPEVHPRCMMQLSLALRAFTGKQQG